MTAQESSIGLEGDTAEGFSARLLVFLVPLGIALGGVYALNARVDLPGISAEAEMERIGAEMRPDELIAHPNPMNKRPWMRGRLAAGAACGGTLILGSSTSGGLASEYFGGGPFFNAWVTGPVLEDYEAATQISFGEGCLPKRVLIGLDPWVLNPIYTPSRWYSLKDQFFAFAWSEGSPTEVLRGGFLYLRASVAPIRERLNYETTKASLKAVIRGAGIEPVARMPASAFPGLCERGGKEGYFALYADGHSAVCPRQEPSVDGARGSASSILSYHREYQEWNEVDAGRAARLRKLVTRMASRGTEVVLFHPPLHPSALEALRREPRIAEKLEEFFGVVDRVAIAAKARHRNLFDPASVGCDESEFRDGEHARPGCYRKIAAALESEG